MPEHTFSISPDPTSPYDPFRSFVLAKGQWTVKLISGDDPDLIAWNAWGGIVSDCETPSNCGRGWLNQYKIWSPALPEANHRVIEVGSGRHESRAVALEASTPATFELPHEAIVTFFIVDSYHDDVGGLTLHLKDG